MEYNIYKENGFENRQTYLKSLAEEYEVGVETIMMFADLLGKGEDFDGLIRMLEDHEEMSLEGEISGFEFDFDED